MAEKKLNFGIIGCGDISIAQARGIAASKNARIAMVMDVNENIAKDLGSQYKVPYTTDIKELLENKEVEAVYIAVPHYLHAPLVIQSANYGKHILVEKPIATTLKDADNIIEVCEKNKVKLSVCFIMRYSNSSVKVKELLKEKAIGEIIGIKMTQVNKKPDTYWSGGFSGRVKTDWRILKEKSGGGVLIMNFSHNIDLMRSLTGLEVDRVYSEYDTLNSPVEVEDFTICTLRYKNSKAIGWIEASSCATGDFGPEGTIKGDRIYGIDGQIIIGNPLYVYTKKKIENLESEKWNKIDFEPAFERKLLTEDFADAILGNKPTSISGLDGRKCLEVILSAYESGRLNKAVKL